MSARAPAPAPPEAGGLPSLGLLSLKEEPVAAKALAQPLALEGEDDGWVSVEEEDIGVKKAEFTTDARKKVKLWEGPMMYREVQEMKKNAATGVMEATGKMKEVPDKEQNAVVLKWNWGGVHEALQDDKFNGPWRTFYGSSETAVAAADQTNQWAGWSKFSMIEGVNDKPFNKYHATAHYMAEQDDPDMDASERALVSAKIKDVKKVMDVFRLYVKGKKPPEVEVEIARSSPFRDGYPGDTKEELVDACQTLTAWMQTRDCSLSEDAMAEGFDKDKLVETFNKRLRDFLDASEKAEGADAASLLRVDTSQKREELERVNDLFSASGGQKSWETLMVLPPGCMVHKRLRSKEIKEIAGTSTTLGENVYVGARYDYWKAQMRPGAQRPKRYEFYMADTPTKAWFVFLGVILSPSAMDPNTRSKRKGRDCGAEQCQQATPGGTAAQEETLAEQDRQVAQLQQEGQGEVRPGGDAMPQAPADPGSDPDGVPEPTEDELRRYKEYMNEDPPQSETLKKEQMRRAKQRAFNRNEPWPPTYPP